MFSSKIHMLSQLLASVVKRVGRKARGVSNKYGPLQLLVSSSQFVESKNVVSLVVTGKIRKFVDAREQAACNSNHLQF